VIGRLHNLPLHRKLTAIVVVTTVAAILMASVATVAYETYTFRSFLSQELETTADVIGATGSAALRFGVARDAEATLRSLRAKEHVSAACFFTPRGELFAAYIADGYEVSMPTFPLSEGIELTDDEMVAVKHIRHDGDFLGSVHIISSLDSFYAQVQRSVVAAVLIILACSALALATSLRVLHVIAEPIDNLIDTANRVAQTRDYSLRATKFADDDMGSLADEFNDMLQRVQRRDAELEQAVLERTAELSDSLDEKVVLLREVHHRVKNNLQIIASLLSLQSNRIDDAETLALFTNSETRVRAMAAIHERLYLSEDLAKVDFVGYIETLIESLFDSYSVDADNVRLVTEIDDVTLDLDQAIPCGLMVNELVSNSLKYAFPAGTGELRVRMASEHGFYVLEVSDNGVGFPEEVDYLNTDSLGLQLITSLTRQLQGRVEMVNHDGTSFRIEFPQRPQRPTL
jgi:two-component sensor histidine kinase